MKLIKILIKFRQFQIEELKKDPSGFYYKKIVMNIYQELFTTKMYEKLWSPAINTLSMNNVINENHPFEDKIIEHTVNTAINNFTESFFEKVALVEFESSIYNQLECAPILKTFYEEIVSNEIKSIQNKSNTILVNPFVSKSQLMLENAATNKIHPSNLSLTILDFGNLKFLFSN